MDKVNNKAMLSKALDNQEKTIIIDDKKNIYNDIIDKFIIY